MAGAGRLCGGQGLNPCKPWHPLLLRLGGPRCVDQVCHHDACNMGRGDRGQGVLLHSNKQQNVSSCSQRSEHV
jgi:hypothetical protein